MREIVRVHHAYDPIASPFMLLPQEAPEKKNHTLAGVEIFVGKQVKVQVEPFITRAV